MFVSVYMFECVYVCVLAGIYVMCEFIYVCVFVSAYMYVNVCTCISCMYVYECVYMCECVCYTHIGVCISSLYMCTKDRGRCWVACSNPLHSSPCLEQSAPLPITISLVVLSHVHFFVL